MWHFANSLLKISSDYMDHIFPVYATLYDLAGVLMKMIQMEKNWLLE